jgi:purine-nucleoside phosphorylase
MLMTTFDQLTAIAAQIRKQTKLKPTVAILLGTGLGGVAKKIKADVRIPYDQLDGMPRATAESHKGEIVLGTLSGITVVAFSGRLHCYEGHSPAEVVAPVRLAKVLGAKILIMGSAVGGLNPHYDIGDLAILDDHINFMGINPLVGANDERLGSRWPDMFETYDRKLVKLADEIAMSQKIHLHKAVYVGVMGPNLETKAEYRMLRTLGGDVVGMSTVPEAIAAVHCGLRTLAFAIITDRCIADALEPANIPKIIAAANGAEPKLTQLITGVLAKLK